MQESHERKLVCTSINQPEPAHSYAFPPFPRNHLIPTSVHPLRIYPIPFHFNVWGHHYSPLAHLT